MCSTSVHNAISGQKKASYPLKPVSQKEQQTLIIAGWSPHPYNVILTKMFYPIFYLFWSVLFPNYTEKSATY